jgi:hypothetical protein
MHSTSTAHTCIRILRYNCTCTAAAATVEGVFTAQVYTRGLIARLLGLPSEQLLIEWGITLGNDYTAQFDSIPGKSHQPESMLAYVKQQGLGYLVPDGGNTELAQALQFTRLLYEVRSAVAGMYMMKYMICIDNIQEQYQCIIALCVWAFS